MIKRVFFTVSLFLLMILLALSSFAVDDYDEQKVIIMSLHVKDNSFTYSDSKIIYGYPPNNFNNFDDLNLRTLDDNGKTVTEFGIEDPRIFRVLDLTEQLEEPTHVIKDDIDFEVILPLDEGADKVGVYDKDDNLLLDIDLKNTISNFCTLNPYDGLCGSTGNTFLKLIGFAGAGIFFVVLLYSYVNIKNRKKRAKKK